MKRFRKHVDRRHVVAVAAISALAVAAFATSASAVKVTLGNIVITADGGVSPKALPKHKLAPITLTLKGTMGTTDGTHVPALNKLALLFDKHGTVDTKGFPTCKIGQITNTLTKVALKTCKKALVGTGTVSAEVQFPDQGPVPAKGKLLVFNSVPKGGDPVFIQHTYVSDPIATTVVTVARVTNVHGKYGKATTIQIPPLSGGYGSLTGFTAKLHKDFTYKGKKHSIFIAECANGHFFAHGDFFFTGGAALHGDVVKTCIPKG